MPLIRYIENESFENDQVMIWGEESVSYGKHIVRYSDVNDVSVMFSHTKHARYGITNDDTIWYYLRINGLLIERKHSAFNRVSAKAQSIGEGIEKEFEANMENLYRYIVPGLFKKKVDYCD